MSLFGKMMAILNVLAAGAFLFLAAQDYAVRQQWAYAVFKHRLAIDGLPVDEDEIDDEQRPIAPNIDAELAQFVTGDTEVRTLEQFLEHRKAEIDQLLETAAVEKRELAAYAEVLIALARTEQDRQLLLDVVAAKTEQERQQLLKGPIALTKFKEMYQAQFDAIPQLKDREARRQAIARLLVAWSDVLPNPQERARRQKEIADRLTPDKRRHPTLDPEMQRLARVLGPKQLGRELAEQAAAIERWVFEVEDTRNRNRTHFAYTHTDLVNSLLPWHGALADQVKFLAWKKLQADEQVALAQNQIKEVAKLTDELTTSKQETAKQMDRLTQKQDELHDVRVKLRDADIVNQLKEMLIRKLEGLGSR